MISFGIDSTPYSGTGPVKLAETVQWYHTNSAPGGGDARDGCTTWGSQVNLWSGTLLNDSRLASLGVPVASYADYRAGTVAQEVGHAMRMTHTQQGSIMRSLIQAGGPFVPTVYDVGAFQALYYTR